MRVVVIGSSCSGKSTFAEALARARGFDFVELDELYWGPQWTPKPTAEFQRLVRQSAARSNWVSAGNYSIARQELWPRATAIVWLNFGLGLLLWRGLRRSLSRSLRGTELFHGNRETLRRAFLSRESLLWWIASTFHRRRREFSALRASPEYRDLAWLEARTQAQADAILARLQNGPRP